MTPIGKKLKEIRKILGFKTQEKFSEYVGVKRATYANYETGKTMPNSEFLELLCLKTKIDGNWLLTGEGDMMGQAAAPQLEPQPEPQPTTEKAPIDFYLLESLIRLIEEKPPMPPALKAQKIIEAYQRVVEVTDAEPQAANQATVDTE